MPVKQHFLNTRAI